MKKTNKKTTVTAPIEKSKFKGKGALDAFFNLLSLISLGWTTWAVGSIYFEMIYRYLEVQAKIANVDNFSEQSLKYAIASLIIVAPVYYLAVNLLHNKYKKDELNHNSGVYRWLTYLMLLVSSLSIVGSLIALIASFLNGDYSLSVILKILVVMIIAGFIFGYYFYDLKRKNYKQKDLVSVIVGIVVGIIICIAIVLGFMNVETPAKARARLLDSRTENALSNLVMSISSNYSLDKKIEGNINLAEWINPSKEISIEFITYRKVSDKEFELCAEFGTESLIGRPISVDDMPWAGHKSGKECYTFDAEKELAKYSKNSYTDPEQMLQDKINASQNPPVASPGLEPATAPVK